MEGERAWSFAAPAFAHSVAPAEPLAGATYLPERWKKRRRRGRKQQGRKRHKAAGGSGVRGAVAPPPPAPPACARLAPAPPPDPTQLAPLRCSWSHPAVLDLLAQQCWPAAGPAAVLPRGVAAAAGCAPATPWWNRMLPSLSLLHPPLSVQRQAEAVAAGSSNSDAGALRALPLPRPNVLVGYEEDWLEVAPEVLPLWQATPLAPFAGPKALLHYLLCPQPLLASAQQLVKDVGSAYETCNLGVHAPASSEAVRAFPLPSAGDGVEGRAAERQPAEAYLAGLRVACEQLQRQLLLDPPPELEQMQGSSLEDGAEPAVLVYLACPIEAPEEQAAALLEAASCLAPCTPLGATSTLGPSLCLLPHADSGQDLAGSSLQVQQLAPCEPQQPDRPATATPAADTSRAPGGTPPLDEQADAAAASGAEQQQEQQQEQAAEKNEGKEQQYHGAAQVLHEQQRGDFRQLPVRHVQRPESGRPINLVLQLLSPAALADIDGTAARCTAFALYSKMRHVPTDSRVEQLVATAQPLEAQAATLPFCSQPLLVLASAAAVETGTAEQQRVQLGKQPVQLEQQQQQQQQTELEDPPLPSEPAPPLPALPPSLNEEQQEDGECMELVELQSKALQDVQQQQASSCQLEAGDSSSEPAAPRTLHCFYALPPPGCPFLSLALADTCGELLHVELLDMSAEGLAGLGFGIAGSSTDSLMAAAPAAAVAPAAGSSGRTPASRVCQLVLQRCLELLGSLRAASSPPGLVHSLAIAAAGMQPAEREAWRRLVGGDASAALALPAGAELAVLDLHAFPPARFAGPDPPSGCRLLLERSNDGGGMLQARVLWLPPADGTSSLLPREHDVLRSLLVGLVGRCGAQEAAAPAWQPAEQLQGEQQRSQEASQQRSEEDSLCSLAGELHGLAWLHAAFQGACLRTVAGGGQAAPPDAHLPMHAALASQLHSLLTSAMPCMPVL
ncbi:hypothetical protein ABPG75_007937 [Micractinium tetrahymenae]